MARGEQLARQWRIIQTLMRAKEGKTVSDLADELACRQRTIYRDLEALQFAGFPIYNARKNGKKSWGLLDTVKDAFPIPLSLTELLALYFSRDMMKVLENTYFYDAIESFFNKIKTTLSPEYVRYLTRISDSLSVNPLPYKDYGEYQAIISQLNEAVLKSRQVVIDYFSMSRKAPTKRKVAPYKLWFFDGIFYLIAHCSLRKEVRIFAVDRIRDLETTDDTFNMPEDFDPDRLMQDSFGIYLGEPVQVKIHFDADVAGYIAEKIWHANQKIEHRKDGSLILSLQVAGIDEIRHWVMRWGAKAKVLEPQSLKNAISAEAKAMCKHYDV